MRYQERQDRNRKKKEMRDTEEAIAATEASMAKMIDERKTTDHKARKENPENEGIR